MTRWLARIGLILALVAATATGAVAGAAAQEGGGSASVELRSPYVGVAVEAGDTASFDLEVSAPFGEEVRFEVGDVPEGWTAQIRGGGYVVDRVLVDEGLRHNLKLQVEVPPTAPDGSYMITVTARGARSSASIDFGIDVAKAVGGGVALETEFPALRGPSDVKFTFTLDLENNTGEEIQFGLQTQGPRGWQIDARPSGQSRASTVTVGAGSSERVTVDVDPPDFTPAGTYSVAVEATGSGESASVELAVQITGNFAMTLTTTDQRLNMGVQAGKPSELSLVVQNDGTAPLTDVSLRATAPRGWDVSFAPETIDRIEPGETAEVVATVTPADDAIVGDYRITLRSQVDETSDTIDVRATVETSLAWGLVGVAVILIALITLGLVFRRFGRR